MNKRQSLVEEAKSRLERLGVDMLRVANRFLSFLEEAESTEATEEILAIPGILEEIKEAREDLRIGRAAPFEEIKRGV